MTIKVENSNNPLKFRSPEEKNPLSVFFSNLSKIRNGRVRCWVRFNQISDASYEGRDCNEKYLTRKTISLAESLGDWQVLGRHVFCVESGVIYSC